MSRSRTTNGEINVRIKTGADMPLNDILFRRHSRQDIENVLSIPVPSLSVK